MKKMFIMSAAIVLAGLTACKKDRTCACTSQVISETSDDPNFKFTQQPATTSSTKYSNVSKSNPLVESCVSREETYTYQSASYTGTTVVYYNVTQVNKFDCSIK